MKRTRPRESRHKPAISPAAAFLLCLGLLSPAHAVELRQTSVPVGILNQTSDLPTGTTVTTLTAR